MPAAAPIKDLHHSAHAGLDFIKAAFCPLEFTATLFKDHPEYARLGGDEGLAELEVADPLSYEAPCASRNRPLPRPFEQGILPVLLSHDGEKHHPVSPLIRRDLRQQHGGSWAKGKSALHDCFDSTVTACW